MLMFDIDSNFVLTYLLTILYLITRNQIDFQTSTLFYLNTLKV